MGVEMAIPSKIAKPEKSAEISEKIITTPENVSATTRVSDPPKDEIKPSVS